MRANTLVRLGFLSAVLCGIVFAQADRGTIRGTVTDAAGAVVPGTPVAAVNVATGVRSAIATSGAGNYNLPALAPGLYRVETEGPGFKRLVRENIQVNAGVVVSLDLQLEIGATNETVTVTAEAPPLEKDSSDLRTTINPQTFVDLPLAMGNGRNPTSFAVLSPGTKTGAPGTIGAFVTTFNGGQTLSGEIELDGLSVNFPPAQGQPDAITGIAPEAIQEVSIVTSGFSAEFKGGTGTQRYTIRSGTNELHGNLYEFLRNDKLDARPFFAARRAAHRRNEFGGSAGGPILFPKLYNGKDRSFFFVNLQAFRLRTTPATTTTTVPTTAFKQGDFSALRDGTGSLIQLYDPLSTRSDGAGGFARDPFVGNIIPSSRISQIARNVIKYFPDPNRPGIVNNFLGTSPSPFNQNSVTFKIDHRFSSNQSLLFSWALFDRNSISGSVFGDPEGAQADRINHLNHGTGRIAHDWILTPRLINHASLGYNRRNRRVSDRGARPWNQELGIKGLWNGVCAWPSFTFEGLLQAAPYQRLGTGTGFPAELDAVDNYIFSENLSWSRGKHNLKFGVEMRWTRLNYLLPTGCGGFNFARAETGFPSAALRAVTGDSFASLLLGAVDNSGWGINNVGQAPRWHYYSGYAQDDIKLTRAFTLNLGLRWDLYLPYFDKFDNYSIMDPTVPNPAAGGIPGAIIFAGDGPGRSGRRRLTNGIDYNNLSPRVGLAWSVRPNLVVRAAGDITYFPSYPYGTGNFRGISMGFSTSAGIGSPDQGITPAFYLDKGFPLQVPQPPFIDAGYGVGQGTTMYYPTAHLLSLMQQWNFNIQYEFARNWVLDAGYVGNKGNRLVGGLLNNQNQVDPRYLSQGVLLNRPIDDPAVAAAGFRAPYPNFIQSFPIKPTLAQALRPFPQYTDVNTGLSQGPSAGSANEGHLTYHALQVKLQKQLSQGLFILTSYTWSKKLTDADSSWGGFFSQPARDIYNRKIEKALSPSNPPQRLTLAFTYEVPLGPGKKLANITGPAAKVIGGWEASGILTYQSGFPIVLTFANALPLFNSKNMPDVVPGVAASQYSGGKFDPARDRYLNPNAFRQPAPFTFGNAPSVLSTRDFVLFNEDFGLKKRTKIFERASLEFRFELFNIFNRHRFAVPNSFFGTPGYGTVGGVSGSPRVIQLALKVLF